jgi:hypothetical protein
MNDVPVTLRAFAVKGLQGGLTMHIVPPPIYNAAYQTFKGMHLGFAATAAGLRHGALLHHGLMFPQTFYDE